MIKRAAILAMLPFLACGHADRDGFDDEPPPLAEPPSPEGPSDCVEAFAETTRAVDIVMSMDQSGSMIDESESLEENINLLPGILTASGLDYRLVMIGQAGHGSRRVCVPPPLGGENCGSNGTLFRAVDQHIESNDTLMILLRTLDSPAANIAWRDFLRPSVLKVFVPITDDDSLDIQGAMFDFELLHRSEALFGSAQARNYVFFPVIGTNDFPDTTPCPSSARPGAQYRYLATLTNGKWLSVCRPSLRSVLEEIGKAVKEVVSCEVAVPDPPPGITLDLAKINVRLTPANGSPAVVPQDNRPCADGADGWQFSADRKKLVLCGGTCASARSDPATKFTVGFGCNTIVR